MEVTHSGFSIEISRSGQPLASARVAQETQNNDEKSIVWTISGDAVGVVKNAQLVLLSGVAFWKPENSLNLQQIANRLLESAQGQIQTALKHLSGAFSLVVVNLETRETLAAIDRIGQRSLYYHQGSESLQLATSVSRLADVENRQVDIAPQGIFNYIFFHMVPATGSIYENVSKLQAAHCLVYTPDTISIQRYWTPEFSEAPLNLPSAHRELMEHIQSAVGQFSSRKNVGSFLSGGLDSSTVSGVLAQQVDHPSSFSIGFDAEGYDEIAYARIASKHFQTKQNEYYVTPDDVIETVPKIAAFYDEPFGNSSALPAFFCARFAREHNIELLLAGDGGDELFAGNERYAKQGVFEIYQKLPAILRKGLMEPVASLTPSSIPLLGKFKSYINQASTTLPERLNTYNFLRQHAPDEIFNTDFLAQCDIDLPLAIQQKLYDTPENASTLNRMLYHDWQLTLADNDLQKVNRMCEMAGIEVAYPLIDDRLLEFSARIPSADKLPGSSLRHFYKEAMKDFLPTEIINKPKHGFGLPFGVWMTDNKQLQELAYDNLLAIKSHGFFNNDFIDRTIHLHKNVHASFYGELVWILMMLSLWLQKH